VPAPVNAFTNSFAPIAVASRSGFVESVHHGAAVATAPDGAIVGVVGDPSVVVYPRSCLKPLQVDAMLALGLEVPDDQVAIACASHAGTPVHLAAVRALLGAHGLDEGDLQNTPAHALSDPRGAEPASSLRQNCSGKHAAMLATCVVRGWSIDHYLEPDHPLQVAITAHLGDLGCTVRHVGVDGCGAPTHAIGLDELARVYGQLASNGSVVARAMRAHPLLVSGEGRDATVWMEAVPGLVAKEGAAGMMALGRDDGRAAAFKVADGSDLARRATIPAALRWMGVVEGDDVAAAQDRLAVPVLGHGRPVGTVEPLEWIAWSS
jgi:L-asparaginase II